MPIFGQIWACAKNMAKWGIPEKTIKNATQKRWIQVRRTIQSKVTATKLFFTKKKPLVFDLVKMKIYGVPYLDKVQT